MVAKLLAIFGSVRFWLITIAWAGFYASLVQAGGFDWVVLLKTIGEWLGTVAGVGTLDKFGQNIGGK
jgi:hypothetical protein